LNDIDGFGGDFTFVIYKAFGKGLQYVQNGKKRLLTTLFKTITSKEREA
jgi:hypothetical protein